jgi:hypothetical protein
VQPQRRPHRDSPFLYVLVSERESAYRLDFTGRQVGSLDAIDARQKAQVTRSLREEGSGMWKLLARAIAADPRASRGKCASRRR